MHPIHIALRDGILPGRDVWQVLHEDRDAIVDKMYDLWGVERSDRFAGPTCVSIERKDFADLSSTPYWICEKTDGIRYIMMCTVYNGLNVIVIINRKHEVFLLGIDLPTPMFAGTILDGELTVNKKSGRAHYLVFDAMVVAGQRFADKPFGIRLGSAINVLGLAAQPQDAAVVVQAKKFFPMPEIEKFLEHSKKMAEYFDDDGVVLTPDPMPVVTFKHKKMFKWKPADKHTIDFVVSGGSINVYDRVSKKIKKVGALRQETTERGEPIREGDIVECGIRGAAWYPIMIRRDKNTSNDVETFRRTIGNVKENIQMKEFVDLAIKGRSACT